jgi:uncharacterized protein (TIGR03437 family)
MVEMRFFALLLTLPACAAAQLIPAGQPVPKGPNPPVVFVNGYQSSCIGSDFASTFYAADKLLQANSIVTLFFDNCSIGGVGPTRPSLEAEGVAFGQFLAALKYTDGTPVTQVDVVAHSMGGLIIRAYLAGKQDVTPAVFTPPLTPVIRRAIFIATPNFGTPIASLLGAIDVQTQEMSPGSQFLFDLNSWNEGSDDLRGISAISIAGNGGAETKLSAFDDGVVALTSASLGFYRPGVTRVVPDCHTSSSLLQLAGFCSAGTPVITNINTDPNNPVSQILISFLAGTDAWKSTGTAAEATASLSAEAGLLLQLRDMNDVPIPAIGATITNPSGSVTLSANGASNVVYSDTLSATPTPLKISPLSGAVQNATVDLSLSPTTELVAIVKPGPVISPKGIIPAAGPAAFPLDVAAGAYVSVYGTNLASATAQSGIPYPTQISDVQVLVDGVPQQLVFVSAGQINFVYSNAAPGLTKLTVKNMNGQNTLNVRVAAAVPSIFLLDNGRAAALNALTGTVVGPSTPLHALDFLSVYLTGLGATTTQNGLDAAQIQPTLTIGGQNVPILYAGRTPGFAGLDQINCQLPAGIATGAAVPVVVTSGGRSSNVATLAIQ